jgi:hypothetical protein
MISKYKNAIATALISAASVWAAVAVDWRFGLGVALILVAVKEAWDHRK